MRGPDRKEQHDENDGNKLSDSVLRKSSRFWNPCELTTIIQIVVIRIVFYAPPLMLTICPPSQAVLRLMREIPYLESIKLFDHHIVEFARQNDRSA
jgi:hypothetical protein